MPDQPAANTVLQLRQRAAANPRRIIFPETQDDRVIQAAREIARLKLAIPVLLGGPVVEGAEYIDSSDPQWVDACSQQLFENRKHRGLTLEGARLAVEDPLMFAALLVRIGHVDGCVAGSIATTASVIRAGLYGVGTLAGRTMVSSFFLMQLPRRCLTYADCGVVPDPDAQQLAEIAVSSAESHALLTNETPRVAMLSFSTKASADHPRIGKVRQALELAHEVAPDLLIDGEMQFDAAFDPTVGKRKAPDSPVAGQANVFIFPDLDSGNIAYKITERLGGAQALGPLVQGLSKPCMDLSRGCSVEDIVNVAVIASVLAR